MTAPYQLLPELTDDELRQLAESIQEHGVLVPVVIDDEGNVLDGHNRQLIADSLGIEYPVEMREHLTEAEKRTLALELNLHRRQLTPEVKRALITRSLKADPDLSDRAHARRCGCDHKTVGTVRGSLERRQEIPRLDQRTGADGVKQPAAKADRSTGGELPHHGSPADAPTSPVGEPADEAPEGHSPLDGAGEQHGASSAATTGGSGSAIPDPPAPLSAVPAAPAPTFASVGDLIDWSPDDGQWLAYAEMQRTESTKHFAGVMNKRIPRDADQDIAELCPPEALRSAIFAAEVAATYWSDLAADLKKRLHPSTTDGRHLAAVEG